MGSLRWPAGASRRRVVECNCGFCQALVERHLTRSDPDADAAPEGVEPLTAFTDGGDP